MGTEQGAWLDRLAQEHDNLRAALAWALGEHAEAIRHYQQNLPILRAAGDTPALIRTLTSLALSTLAVGDTDQALEVGHKGLALAGTSAWGLGIALHALVDLPAVVNPANTTFSEAVACQGWCCSHSGSWLGLRPSKSRAS